MNTRPAHTKPRVAARFNRHQKKAEDLSITAEHACSPSILNFSKTILRLQQLAVSTLYPFVLGRPHAIRSLREGPRYPRLCFQTGLLNAQKKETLQTRSPQPRIFTPYPGGPPRGTHTETRPKPKPTQMLLTTSVSGHLKECS